MPEFAFYLMAQRILHSLCGNVTIVIASSPGLAFEEWETISILTSSLGWTRHATSFARINLLMPLFIDRRLNVSDSQLPIIPNTIVPFNLDYPDCLT